jgi:hypothetical protein
VVDDRHYQSSFVAGHPFFAPFDDLIRSVAGDRRNFALLSSERFHAEMIGKHYRLIDMRELRKRAVTGSENPAHPNER